MPPVDAEQIAKWMDEGAEKGPLEAAARERAGAQGFDFEQVRQALQRARTKTFVPAVKPLRRLRRNQGAVNDSLIDAVDALLTVNKQMAVELAALRGEMAVLRARRRVASA